ncbi:Holliday junction resolvase RecU [Staphylococcus aureus]|uniref:Holliday junction resolvase RecU n=1 Tax=Staphylococcus aureus TaxID=1280 RepID=UPI00200B12A7|nr:Holliday junction resolvase RecU [Staphylococcus aureus]
MKQIKAKTPRAPRTPRPAKKMTKSLVNRKIGEGFENVIQQVNDRYLILGKARIYKTHAEVKMIRNAEDYNKIDNAFHAGTAPPDFVGMLANGTHLEFETKTCESYEKGFELKNVKKHQLDQLHVVRKFKGIAFIMVHFQRLGETYVLTLDLLDRFEEEVGRKTIPYEWIRENALRAGFGNGVTFDFLGALEGAGVIS